MQNFNTFNTSNGEFQVENEIIPMQTLLDASVLEIHNNSGVIRFKLNVQNIKACNLPSTPIEMVKLFKTRYSKGLEEIIY